LLLKVSYKVDTLAYTVH